MRKFVATFFIALSLAAPAPSTCGLAAVCGDVGSSFTAVIISTDGVRAEWSTDDESGVSHYKLIRRPDGCQSQICLTPVVTVYPRGNCTAEDYQYEDEPPGEPEDWTYRLEVYGTGSSLPACTYESDPE